MKRRPWVLRVFPGVLLVLFSALPLAGSETAFRLDSPYSSLDKSRQLFESAALVALLELDYDELGAGEGDWKLASTPGLLATRFFTKATAEGPRTLELALSRSPSGTFDIRGYGVATIRGARSANPELADLEAATRKLAAKAPKPKKRDKLAELEFLTYQLSYTQTDRAIALIKTLGFPVVEYEEDDGETLYDKIYDPKFNEEDWKPPLVIKLIDSPKTSLMDEFYHPDAPKTSSARSAKDKAAVPDIGGTFLHHVTSGEPQQRLLILYDPSNPEPIEMLVNLLSQEIDVPAQQIVIDALVIEIDTDRLRDLGVTFGYKEGETSASFEQNDLGGQSPFTFSFDKYAMGIVDNFQVNLSAMVSNGEAEVLSNPSVLVLDGRQARIQVGQQVPVVSSTATVGVVSQKVEYFPVGIVLNLRPRVTEDREEVTMQVETIVSAVRSTSSIGTGDSVLQAPTVDNRQVQTFVRVADNTPFIIGGLISTTSNDSVDGIPGLSKIPLLGALFRRTVREKTKREVVVVITPHVVPLGERNFSYVIPQESEIFDESFGHKLFRNAYRIRKKDVFDFEFIKNSDVVQHLHDLARNAVREEPGLRGQEPFASLLEGAIPGEEILVRRMLWEAVKNTGFDRPVDIGKMILFLDDGHGGIKVTGLQKLLDEQKRLRANTLVLSFDANPLGTTGHPFVPPTVKVSYENLSKSTFRQRLLETNNRTRLGEPDNWTILLTDEFQGSTPPMQRLKAVMVMKRVLALNRSLPLTIRDFYVGRQVIFPSEEDVSQSAHLIDAEAARLFFESDEYYSAFEVEFNERTQAMVEMLEGGASRLEDVTTRPSLSTASETEETKAFAAAVQAGRQALASQDRGEVQRALSAMKTLSDANPEHLEAQRVTGELAYRVTDWVSAVRYFERGVVDEARPALGFYYAVALFEMGDREAAATVLQRALPSLEKTSFVEDYRKKILGLQ